MVLAFWLEHKFSKAQILELYLNRVYFGAGAYGVEGAAQRYFGKSARQLTLAEAALLAGLVQVAVAAGADPQSGRRRAAGTDRAHRHGGAETDWRGRRASSRLLIRARAVKPAGADSVNYVADWVMDAVDDLVGRFDQDIVVETSIDPALQGAAERALADALAQKGEKLGVGEGALVAMTPDGVVRALVGGKSYADSQFNRAIAAKRQPGSAFKPFVYLTALEHGLTPDTVRDDGPIAVKGWKPENYEHAYHGPGDADAGARQFAQHRFGAPDAGVRARRGDPHRLSARHQFTARTECFDRARHFGSVGAGAGHRLRNIRKRRAWRSRRTWSNACAGRTARRFTLAPAKTSAASSIPATWR